MQVYFPSWCRKMKGPVFSTMLSLVFAFSGYAQDTLPSFSAVIKSQNKILISWENQYPVVNQISIQRSFDSTRNFKTILSVPAPSIPQNGFLDTKADNPRMFYRLFIVLDSGKYIFTPSRRPVADNRPAVTATTIPSGVSGNEGRIEMKPDLSEVEKKAIAEKNKKPVPERIYIVKRRDTILLQLKEAAFKVFRDSLLQKTKDTLQFAANDTLLIKPFVPKEVYKPSRYVFTAKEGNINIVLPSPDQKEYRIVFYEPDSQDPLFELKHVKESPLILDKVNFLHAGWFRFELYENGKIIEKNKFFIPRD